MLNIGGGVGNSYFFGKYACCCLFPASKLRVAQSAGTSFFAKERPKGHTLRAFDPSLKIGRGVVRDSFFNLEVGGATPSCWATGSSSTVEHKNARPARLIPAVKLGVAKGTLTSPKKKSTGSTPVAALNRAVVRGARPESLLDPTRKIDGGVVQEFFSKNNACTVDPRHKIGRGVGLSYFLLRRPTLTA